MPLYKVDINNNYSNICIDIQFTLFKFAISMYLDDFCL